jgi:hypothetical protein
VEEVVPIMVVLQEQVQQEEGMELSVAVQQVAEQQIQVQAEEE